MRRATTPTHRFTLDIDPSLISKIRITYAQNGDTILTKNEEDVTLDDNIAEVKLTQEETNLFDFGVNVKIQVRVLTTGGDALASEIFKVPCGRVLDDEVMV